MLRLRHGMFFERRAAFADGSLELCEQMSANHYQFAVSRSLKIDPNVNLTTPAPTPTRSPCTQTSIDSCTAS
jgi:hypothetical protein